MVVPFTYLGPKKPKIQTLVYVQKNNHVLLGLKRRGFLGGYINGYGGKLEEGESIEDCAVRELFEESTLVVTNSDLIYHGYIIFSTPIEDRLVHMYSVTKFTGEPQLTDEMEPYWFDMDEIPYDKMKPDHMYWLPVVLNGEVIIGQIVIDHNENIVNVDIRTQ